MERRRAGGAVTGKEGTADAVRDLILGGFYAPGARLGEVELAASLGVSRTPVREALRQLAAEGLVDLTPHKGARVVAWTEAELEQVFDLRAEVEGLAARRAAERATAAELDDLEKIAREHARASRAGRGRDLDRLYELNGEFHARVVTAAGGASLRTVLGSLVHTAVLFRTLHTYDDDSMQRSSNHHLELVDAMRARDPQWAECVMRAHLFAARASLLGPRDRPHNDGGK
jgi:DNA-binding GntR family transcriptional regulator